MSKAITVKFREDVLRDAERLIPRSKLKNRNAFINEAVRRMNRLLARQELAERYIRQSELVRKESANVLAEFEQLPDEISD